MTHLENQAIYQVTGRLPAERGWFLGVYAIALCLVCFFKWSV